MSMTFIVDGAEKRKTKAGADYLALKIGDKTVSFFDAPDVAVPVKAGDAITCNLKQVRNFWNGKNLRVVDAKTAVVTPFPRDSTAPAPTVATPPTSAVIKEPTQPGESSQEVKAGSRTYAVDVKVGKNGQKYMTITESGGKDGETHRIMVFADHVDEFVDAIEKARKAMK
nr:DUF3276 family protein [Candidatus Sigynarchaeum springense]